MSHLLNHNPVDKTFYLDFLKKLREWDRDAKLILFGSRARGDFRHASDFDFLVLADKFESDSPIDRFKKIVLEIAPERLDITLDIRCYTHSEWLNLSGTLLFSEVSKWGKEITPSLTSANSLINKSH